MLRWALEVDKKKVPPKWTNLVKGKEMEKYTTDFWCNNTRVNQTGIRFYSKQILCINPVNLHQPCEADALICFICKKIELFRIISTVSDYLMFMMLREGEMLWGMWLVVQKDIYKKSHHRAFNCPSITQPL